MYRLPVKNLFMLFICIPVVVSCDIFSSNGEDDTLWGDWSRISSFEGIPRSNAVSFSINGKGYVGTGYNSDLEDNKDRLNDLWEYDPELNNWTQRADFPGTGRSAAVGFVAAGKGYVGTGYNDDIEGNYLKDFWAYNPETNSWDSVAAFGGSARYGAVAFAINDIGYVGTGNDDNDLKDFWKYDPQTDQWERIVSLPGEKRTDAVAFVIDNKAYVGTGRNSGIYEPDFYVYDPETELWARLHNLDEDEDENAQDIPRSQAVAFSLNNKGYITLGDRGGNYSDIWEYDPATDTWTNENLAHFEGNGRRNAAVFAIENAAYLGTGTNGSLYFDDFWKYDPTAENDEESY